MSYRLGVDVGGTFTDLVLVAPDGVARTCKVLSTTADYAHAIIAGVRQLTTEAGIPARDIGEIIHGTTVATNAILERRGARTGLLTTEGFRDLLEIGRLRLSRLYDLDFERPSPLVPRRWRREIRERMNHRGEVVTPLDREGAAAAIERLLAEGVESIAVCFLHAYANPAHEVEVGAMIRERAPHVALTLSSEILPEMREFERTSTAVTNAYVMPVMGRYLASLEGDLTKLETRAPLLVMQSNGGVMTADGGRRRPVHVIESGPAAGVIATSALARAIGTPNALSIDMGGTTAKASIIEGGEIKRTGEFEIGGSMSQGSRLNKGGGFLLRVPAIDIAEVGAGGGSIVSVDGAGALHVGPRSAGAAPGPVCYDNPVEVIESEYPLMIERYGYLPNTGGPGKFRGGLALERQYRFLEGEGTLQLRTDRRHHVAYGLAGGRPGTPSRNVLNPGPDGRDLPAKCTLTVRHGDVFRHELAGAGGWGDPFERDPERVRRDVMEEKITAAYARREYGVAIDERTGAIQSEETARLRARRA